MSQPSAPTTRQDAVPSRRDFVRAAAVGLLGIGTAGGTRQDDGRLRARPGRPTRPAEPGEHALGLSSGRDGVLYVPPSYRPDRPTPLILALHGAGGAGRFQLNGWRETANARGLIILAPDSRGSTWDAVLGGFGPDVGFVDRALTEAFHRCHVDPARLAIAGFSDGASYALSLGLVNGDRFPSVVAFSPGLIVPAEWTGTPKIFVSHGRADPILPIDHASRRLVTMLRRDGYSVTYREFDGGHEIPAGVRAEAVGWVLD